MAFNFREKVDKLDVSREEKRSGGDTAQVILGVEKAELNSRTTPGISGYEVTKLSHDVSANLHHVLMDCLGLQRLNIVLRSLAMQDNNKSHLEHSFCSVALDVISVDDDLDDAVPDLLAHVVSGQTDQVQDHVDVPLVISGVLLSQDRNLHQTISRSAVTSLTIRKRQTRYMWYQTHLENHFLPDAVIRGL